MERLRWEVKLKPTQSIQSRALLHKCTKLTLYKWCTVTPQLNLNGQIVKERHGTYKIDVSEEFPSPSKGQDSREPFVEVPFLRQSPEHARLKNLYVHAETKNPKMHNMTDDNLHSRTSVKFPLLLREKPRAVARLSAMPSG